MLYTSTSTDIPSGSDIDVLGTDTDATAELVRVPRSQAPAGPLTPVQKKTTDKPSPALGKPASGTVPHKISRTVSIHTLNQLSAYEQQLVVADRLLAPPRGTAIHFEAELSPPVPTDDTSNRDQAPAPRSAPAAKPSSVQSVLQLFGPGVRIWCDGVRLSSRQNPLLETVAVASLSFYLGWILVLGVLFIASFFSRVVLALNLVIWSTVLLPARPLFWVPFLNSFFLRTWRMYFRFSLALDDDNFDLTQRYIYAEYPHGVFPLSQMIAISLSESAWPGHQIRSIAASSVFQVPLWRHVMTWMGAAPATLKSFKRLLHKGSVGLVPGGIAEMFMVDEGVERIKIRGRRGFIKLAVEEGVPIVPVYHFGNTMLFRWGPKSWEPLARRWRVALGFIRGRWGIPLLPIPNRIPLFMVVGKPIPVPRVSPSDTEAFESAVTQVQEQLLEAMEQLYNKYKGVYGWQDRPLVLE